MKALVLLIATAFALAAQTIPTLPAFNSITGTSVVCTFESQGTAGELFAQCTQPDGAIAYTAVASPSSDGAVVGHAEIMCLYWTDAPGKFRLQCGNAGKVSIDGFMPPVTRKKRWYLLWR
jgi:hypothetical protein